jgi:hypothetical protein
MMNRLLNRLLNTNDKLAQFIDRHALLTIVSLFLLAMLLDNV